MNPQAHEEIVAALRAAGCGILRRPLPTPSNAIRARGTLMPALLAAVEFKTLIPKSDIASEKRNYSIARARHIFYFAAKTLTDKSLTEIGRACGGRDHATVIHGIRKVACNRQAFEPELSQVLAAFASKESRS